MQYAIGSLMDYKLKKELQKMKELKEMKKLKKIKKLQEKEL